MVKNADSSSRDWIIWDSMRGIVSGGDDERLKPNSSEAEGANNAIDLTPTGFKLVNTAANWNENNKTIIYLAIRRPDGYVGKPPELGTGVFAMDTGAGSSTIPNFDSGFPVDFAWYRQPASTDTNWFTARLIGTNELKANDTNAEASYSDNTWDSNLGWNKNGNTSTGQSWMWKRHAGFDVVTYTGNGLYDHAIPHSLSKPPEMLWTKRRDTAYSWGVAHKGLNGGSDPWDWYIFLNSSNGNYAYDGAWSDTAPTSTHFTLGEGVLGNGQNQKYIAMLFASVDGISKVGSYTGNATAGHAITVGFQPRFLIVKHVSGSGADWIVLDTTRGWASGNDSYLALNSSNAAITGYDHANPTSTGFTISITGSSMNGNGEKYVYYAHA